MKFKDVKVDQQFRVIDTSAPAYMRWELFERVHSYQNPISRLYVNAERIEKQDDSYDGQWVNGAYEVELI